MNRGEELIPLPINDSDVFPDVIFINPNDRAARRARQKRIDRYNDLTIKKDRLCLHFDEMIQHYQKLRTAINETVLTKIALFHTHTNPLSYSIANAITMPSPILSDHHSIIALQTFSNKLLNLIQNSLDYVCSEFVNRHLNIAARMSQLKTQCDDDEKIYINARQALMDFVRLKLPYNDDVIDYAALTVDQLNEYQTILNTQMNFARITINRFNHLTTVNNSSMVNIKKLKSVVGALAARLQGDNFSVFKSIYVKRASRYLSCGNRAISLSGIIIEQSKFSAGIASFFSPNRRFIKPEFNDNIPENKTKVHTLLRQAAVETINEGDTCTIL